MKKLSILFTLYLLGGCAASSVGGYTYKENGRETESLDECMGHCVSKTEDGLHCSTFSKEMASVCKDYLHNR